MSLFGHKQKTVEPDVIPTTVEQAIPIRDVCEDGIFLVGRNLWSKTYRFTDVNYATASKEDKEGMFFAYSEILNTFDAGAMSKITVNNRRLNQTKFRENNMLELQGDSLDKYRNEYNRILAGNANLSNGITQDKYRIMRTITNLINPEKHIYILFNNQALCRQFLAQAEWEGFTIGDKKPTEIEWTDVLAVQPDKKLCHLGFASRMALHSSQKNTIRIDYEKYINGAKHYTV